VVSFFACLAPVPVVPDVLELHIFVVVVTAAVVAFEVVVLVVMASFFACLVPLLVVPDVLVLHVVDVMTAAVVVSSHIGPASSGPFMIVLCPSQSQFSFVEFFGMQEP
jgi:hypothetical protein